MSKGSDGTPPEGFDRVDVADGSAATSGVVGAILCGGRSRRFGSDKALAPAGEFRLGQRVARALRQADIDPVVAIGGTAGAALGLVTVPDRWPGDGPLAGLATALWWAKVGPVLVVPCDLPLLSADAVRALLTARDGMPNGTNTAVVATVDGKPRHSLAIWPAEWSRSVRELVTAGERRFQSALGIGPWVGVEVAAPVMEDVDCPADLDRLLEQYE